MSSNHWTLSFTGQPNQNYIVEGRADLAAGSWTTLNNIPAAPALRTITVRRPLSANHQFYRLVAP